MVCAIDLGLLFLAGVNDKHLQVMATRIIVDNDFSFFIDTGGNSDNWKG